MYLSHYERPRSVQWDVSIYLSLDSKWEQEKKPDGPPLIRIDIFAVARKEDNPTIFAQKSERELMIKSAIYWCHTPSECPISTQ